MCCIVVSSFVSEDMMWLDSGVCFQAEDGIRDLVRSRGLGDVYKRQQYVYAFSDAVIKGAYNSKIFKKIDMVYFKHYCNLSLIHI